MDFLGAVRRKNLEIAEGVAAIEAVSVPLDIKFGRLREPKLLIARAESDRSKLDGNMLAREVDLLDGLEQVRFKAKHLIRAGIDPGAAS